MHNAALYSLILLAYLFGHVISSKEGADLVRDLMAGYPEYHVRPVNNESKPIIVDHRLTPIQMLDIDEKNQIISIKCWLGQTWRDDYLVWDPVNYGGVTQTHIPIVEIWQPDIVLFGSVEDEFKRHFDTDAIITYDGNVTALQPFVLRATCGIDVSFFPFDEQQCQLKFASWSYDGKFMDMTISSASNTDRFITNGEWELVHMPIVRQMKYYVCCPDPFPDITYTIHVRRRSMYYIFNIIFPSFLACILVAVGFYLPSDSGERVTLCVTSILAQFVFLTIVNEFMPPNSEFIPKLQIYFFILIGLVIFSAVVTACTLHMHFQGPNCEAVPPWLRKLAFVYLTKITCMHTRCCRCTRYCNGKSYGLASAANPPQMVNVEQNNFVECPNAQSAENGSLCAVKFVADDQKTPKALPVDDLPEDETLVQRKRVQEWRDVAKIIDRFYLILFCVMLFSILTGFLLALYFGASSANWFKS